MRAAPRFAYGGLVDQGAYLACGGEIEMQAMERVAQLPEPNLVDSSCSDGAESYLTEDARPYRIPPPPPPPMMGGAAVSFENLGNSLPFRPSDPDAYAFYEEEYALRRHDLGGFGRGRPCEGEAAQRRRRARLGSCGPRPTFQQPLRARSTVSAVGDISLYGEAEEEDEEEYPPLSGVGQWEDWPATAAVHNPAVQEALNETAQLYNECYYDCGTDGESGDPLVERLLQQSDREPEPAPLNFYQPGVIRAPPHRTHDLSRACHRLNDRYLPPKHAKAKSRSLIKRLFWKPSKSRHVIAVGPTRKPLSNAPPSETWSLRNKCDSSGLSSGLHNNADGVGYTRRSYSSQWDSLPGPWVPLLVKWNLQDLGLDDCNLPATVELLRDDEPAAEFVIPPRSESCDVTFREGGMCTLRFE